MAEFGNTSITTNIQPERVVQDPIPAPRPDQSGVFIAQGVQNAFSALGNITNALNKNATEQASARGAAVLARYQTELLNIADAVEQDSLTAGEAGTRMRALQREYLGNYPNQLDGINSITSKLMSTSSSVLSSGNNETQAREALIQEGIAAGWTDIPAFLRHRQTAARMSEQQQRIDQMQLDGTEISERDKIESRNIIKDFSDTSLTWLQDRIEAVSNEAAQNPDASAEILNNFSLEVELKLTEFEAAVGNSDVNYVTAPLRSMVEAFNSYAKGETTLEVLKAQQSMQDIRQDILLRADPIIGPKMAMTKVLQNISPITAEIVAARDWDAETTNRVGRILTGQPIDVIVDSPQNDVALNAVQGMIGQYNNDPVQDPEIKNELGNSINGIIESIYKNRLTGEEDVLSYNAVITFLNDPAVGEFIKSNGGISSTYAKEADFLIDQTYNRELLPVLQERWNETVTISLSNGLTNAMAVPSGRPGGPDVVNLRDVVKPIWNGTGVEFVTADGFEGDRRARQLVRDLNQGDNSIAIPLNRVITTGAYLSGLDPKEVFDKRFGPQLFNMTSSGPIGPTAEQTASSGPAGDTQPLPESAFSLADFQDTDIQAAFANLPSQVSNVIGDSSGSNNDSILSFIGSAEAPQGYDTQFSGATTRPPRPLTQMTVGDVLNYQIQMTNNGAESGAVGRYQVINGTLKRLVDTGVVSSNDIFNQETQDKIGVGLLRIRGLDKWLNGEIDDVAFANNLAKEWAGLPLVSGPNAGRSNYAGVGSNAATVSINQVMAILAKMRERGMAQ